MASGPEQRMTIVASSKSRLPRTWRSIWTVQGSHNGSDPPGLSKETIRGCLKSTVIGVCVSPSPSVKICELVAEFAFDLSVPLVLSVFGALFEACLVLRAHGVIGFDAQSRMDLQVLLRRMEWKFDQLSEQCQAVCFVWLPPDAIAAIVSALDDEDVQWPFVDPG
jgi:hypothetical protein